MAAAFFVTLNQNPACHIANWIRFCASQKNGAPTGTQWFSRCLTCLPTCWSSTARRSSSLCLKGARRAQKRLSCFGLLDRLFKKMARKERNTFFSLPWFSESSFLPVRFVACLWDTHCTSLGNVQVSQEGVLQVLQERTVRTVIKRCKSRPRKGRKHLWTIDEFARMMTTSTVPCWTFLGDQKEVLRNNF